MRSDLLRAALLACVLALAGCNTVAGAGKDIQRAGSAISNAAEGK